MPRIQKVFEITGLETLHYTISQMVDLMNCHDTPLIERTFENQWIRITHNKWWLEWSGLNILVAVTRNPFTISVKSLPSSPKLSSNTDSKKLEKTLIENVRYYLKNHWHTDSYNRTGMPVESILFSLKELEGDAPKARPRDILSPIEVPARTNPVKKITDISNSLRKSSSIDNPTVIPQPRSGFWENDANYTTDEERRHVFFLELLKDSRKTVKDLNRLCEEYGRDAIWCWANELPPSSYGKYIWNGSALHVATTLEKWETLEGGKNRWIPIEERSFRIEVQMEKLLWLAPFIETWFLNYYGMDPISHLKVCKAPACLLFTSDDFLPTLRSIQSKMQFDVNI